VLVEPTSAVDAHTEALIAERLAAHRAGRTTVVTTSSPLLLHHADRVALLSGGVVTAYGTHEELLRTDRSYRSVVARALDEGTGEEER
jgi:ABC-type multidrug transport system fused ATPase/permease subunit